MAEWLWRVTQANNKKLASELNAGTGSHGLCPRGFKSHSCHENFIFWGFGGLRGGGKEPVHLYEKNDCFLLIVDLSSWYRGGLRVEEMA